jgi:hypothetical protein
MTFPSNQIPMRGDQAVAARPQTEFQRRLESSQTEGMERASQVRNGGPGDMSEIDRELTMASGALQGVQQRIAELAVKLGPVLPGDTVGRMMQGADFPRKGSDEFEINTEVGQRIRQVTNQISELEDAVSMLLSVRL